MGSAPKSAEDGRVAPWRAASEMIWGVKNCSRLCPSAGSNPFRLSPVISLTGYFTIAYFSRSFPDVHYWRSSGRDFFSIDYDFQGESRTYSDANRCIVPGGMSLNNDLISPLQRGPIPSQMRHGKRR